MSEVSVVLVGCGAPLRSMGWYHATQILHEGSDIAARLDFIVEPWFMSEAGKSSPGGAEFAEFQKTLEATKGIKFFSRVEDVPPVEDGVKRLAIISARTSDNPSLFASCLEIGCHAIFLEKPGAPSVSELESMRDDAKKSGVSVFMGFNKNVSKFVTKSRSYANTHPNTKVTFLHNNNYDDSPESLGECFERNSEGMLKNMAIHELALSVTYYGVTVDNISSVEADKEYSSCKTLTGPSSGKSFTDFTKLKFTIKTKDDNEVSIAADRCGGDDSVGIVSNAEGKELVRFTMPDEEDADTIKNAEERIAGAMPYFYVQDPDYGTLKRRVARAIAEGGVAEGVATIDVAVETLKVAEYLTPILMEQLK
mmetsp:Transcript_24311/g.43949  ORF Transcript_24311/g.43949 Transcript_24311/m.43949 type:complete len:366 (+) Transcript_24311:97-1194(+)